MFLTADGRGRWPDDVSGPNSNYFSENFFFKHMSSVCGCLRESAVKNGFPSAWPTGSNKLHV
jgi:hypothetical protein